MAGVFVLRLPVDGETAEWVRLDSDARLLAPPVRGTLAEAAAQAREHRLLVLVPAVHVVTTTAPAPPTRNPARMRQMLPYSLEEALAQDVEQLFFAVGPRMQEGRIAVSIVARQRMDEWMAQLNAAGLTPSAIYAETEGVPNTPGALTLIAESGRIMGRCDGSPTAFALEGIGLLPLRDMVMAPTASAHDSGPRNILIYADEPALERHRTDIDALRASLTSTEARLLEQGALPHLAATVLARPGTNLLQGPYAPRSNWGPALRPWRWAASLLVGWVVLAMATQAGNYIALRRQELAVEQSVTALCRDAFGTTQTAACRREAQSRLAAAGADSAARSTVGFLPTLVAIAENRDTDSAITALSYRNGVMDLRLVAPSVPVLDEFVRRMAERSALDVRIQSANPSDDGIESQLQIVGNTP